MKVWFLQIVVLVTFFLGSQLLAHSDTGVEVDAGRALYTQCTGCHAPGYHRTGPKHCELLGRRAGHDDKFAFTSAMKNSGIIWTKETLDQFLRAPLAMLPGTSMGFAGVSSTKDRAQLIAFLASLTKNNPLCR